MKIICEWRQIYLKPYSMNNLISWYLLNHFKSGFKRIFFYSIVAVELSIKKLLCHAVVNEMMQLISCRKNQQSFITTGNCKKAIEQKYDKSANINRNSLENIFPTMII